MIDDGESPLQHDKLNDQARAWLVRLTSGNVKETDLKDFRAWVDCSPDHRRAFDQERQFWHGLHALAPQRAYGRRASAILSRRAFLFGAGAMAAVGIVAYPRISVILGADYRTAPGEQRTVSLPDDSSAFMNTDTALAVEFDNQVRSVRLLQGEAQFTVNENASGDFHVISETGSSVSSDASFNVMVGEGLTTVTTLAGKVRVTSDNAEGTRAVSLQSRQQTSYSDGISPSVPVDIDPDVELAWRRGRMIFSGRPFARAVQEVARYLPEKVIIANRAQNSMRVSAAFSTHEPLAALEALASTQGLAVHRILGIAIFLT